MLIDWMISPEIHVSVSVAAKQSISFKSTETISFLFYKLWTFRLSSWKGYPLLVLLDFVKYDGVIVAIDEDINIQILVS